MKIVSKFTDFYDFSSEILGYRPDESPVYYRGINETEFYLENDGSGKVSHVKTKTNTIVDFHKYIPDGARMPNLIHKYIDCASFPDIRTIVVGTRAYIHVRFGKGTELIKYSDKSLFRKLALFDISKPTAYAIAADDSLDIEPRFYKYLIKPFENFTDVELVKLKQGYPVQEEFLKIIGVPVFSYTVDAWHEGTIDPEVPNLREYGLDRFLDVHETYQEIARCLTIINGSPDIQPPVELDNESKIHAAGFDKKTSFRHPVSVRQLYGKMNNRR